MQYFRPPSGQYVGDCMPFFDGATFHVYWLLDHDHHRRRDGLGAHEWAHSSSDDLVSWREHELAIPIGEPGAYDGGSICTGSIVAADGIHYAYFANKEIDPQTGSEEQSVSLATSGDGVRFVKSPLNPILKPADRYLKRNFRDPHVFLDEVTGVYHMLVSATLRREGAKHLAGCLAHYTSVDLVTWMPEPQPFLADQPGTSDASAPESGICPECADYFLWNGWHYLLFSNYGVTRYRMARSLRGPWTTPRVDTLDTQLGRVFKTAAYRDGRRLAVAFVPMLEEDRDSGAQLYGGNMLFREIRQAADGTLLTCWPEEMMPEAAPGRERAFAGDVLMRGVKQRTIGRIDGDFLLEASVEASPNRGSYGLELFRSGAGPGYRILFSPVEQSISIRSSALNGPQYRIDGVEGLESSFGLRIARRDGLLDVEFDRRRTLIARLPEQTAGDLVAFTEGNALSVRDITVSRRTWWSQPVIEEGEVVM